jgi:DNA (cytosine-5)-methyltransferase 1
MLVKQRKAEMSVRGIYIQDKELLQTVFQVGSHFDFEVDLEKKFVKVIQSETNLKNTVSKRKMKDYVKPVIDIRKKEVLTAFNGCDSLEIDIYEKCIYIYGVQPEVEVAEEIAEVVIECNECKGAGQVFNEYFEIEYCICQEGN